MDETVAKRARAARHARIMRAPFFLEGQHRGDLLIKNVSEHGVGARCDCSQIHVGDAIVIGLPVVGDVSGHVRWIQDDRCGVETTEALDVDRLRFRHDTNLLSSPTRFAVADRFQPVTKTYRPGFKRTAG